MAIDKNNRSKRSEARISKLIKKKKINITLCQGGGYTASVQSFFTKGW